MSPWIRYSLVRLGVFGGVFALLYSLDIRWWVALIFATLLSFTVAYIFMGNARRALSQQLSQRLSKKEPDADADIEDSLTP